MKKGFFLERISERNDGLFLSQQFHFPDVRVGKESGGPAGGAACRLILGVCGMRRARNSTAKGLCQRLCPDAFRGDGFQA